MTERSTEGIAGSEATHDLHGIRRQPLPDVGGGDSGLVDTPEEKPRRERKPRGPRKPKPEQGDLPETPEAAE